ncbi:hypothetical protein EV127DRAFT_449235 [Xylaria flabelliformis]|nr:hypothetical protein EV127DRAFT_449235 [Xylaria flabelliformis]
MSIVNLVQGQTRESRREAQDMVQYISDLEGLESELTLDDYKRLLALDLVNISFESRNEKFATKIVDSLLSKTMDHQEEVIPKAHDDTFRWIFQKPRCLKDGTPL